VSCEGERECEIPVLMIVGPRGQKLHELGTPCPEYPGLRLEYPGRVLEPTINTCLLRRAHQSQMLNSDFPMDKQWHMRRENRRYHRDFTGTLVSSVFRYMLVNGYCVESSTTTNNGGEHACHTSIYPSRFACHKLADLQMQATTCPPLAGEAIYTLSSPFAASAAGSLKNSMMFLHTSLGFSRLTACPASFMTTNREFPSRCRFNL